MGTRSIVGYMNRDGSGAATFVGLDGYPTGLGMVLLRNWDDPDLVTPLVDGGNIVAVFDKNDDPDLLQHYADRFDAVAQDGTDGARQVIYLKREHHTFPVPLDRQSGFFERVWAEDIEYLYLHTPDGWLARPLTWEDTSVRPIPLLVDDYNNLMTTRGTAVSDDYINKTAKRRRAA